MGTRRAPLHGCFKAINCQFENPPFPCCDNALEDGSIKSIIDDDEEVEADEEIKDSSLLGSPVGEAFKFIVGDEDRTVVVDDDEEEVVDTADAVAATAAAATYSSTSCTCAK